MATRVKFAIPAREIQNTGVTFVRDVDGTKHGELTVRQNHLDWKPSNHEYVYRVSWDAFARFAEDANFRRKPKTTAVRSRKKLVRAQSA